MGSGAGHSAPRSRMGDGRPRVGRNRRDHGLASPPRSGGSAAPSSVRHAGVGHQHTVVRSRRRSRSVMPRTHGHVVPGPCGQRPATASLLRPSGAAATAADEDDLCTRAGRRGRSPRSIAPAATGSRHARRAVRFDGCESARGGTGVHARTGCRTPLWSCARGDVEGRVRPPGVAGSDAVPGFDSRHAARLHGAPRPPESPAACTRPRPRRRRRAASRTQRRSSRCTGASTHRADGPHRCTRRAGTDLSYELPSRWRRSSASMNASRSPSSTASTLPVS